MGYFQESTWELGTAPISESIERGRKSPSPLRAGSLLAQANSIGTGGKSGRVPITSLTWMAVAGVMTDCVPGTGHVFSAWT